MWKPSRTGLGREGIFANRRRESASEITGLGSDRPYAVTEGSEIAAVRRTVADWSSSDSFGIFMAIANCRVNLPDLTALQIWL